MFIVLLPCIPNLGNRTCPHAKLSQESVRPPHTPDRPPTTPPTNPRPTPDHTPPTNPQPHTPDQPPKTRAPGSRRRSTATPQRRRRPCTRPPWLPEHGTEVRWTWGVSPNPLAPSAPHQPRGLTTVPNPPITKSYGRHQGSMGADSHERGQAYYGRAPNRPVSLSHVCLKLQDCLSAGTATRQRASHERRKTGQTNPEAAGRSSSTTMPSFPQCPHDGSMGRVAQHRTRASCQ